MNIFYQPTNKPILFQAETQKGFFQLKTQKWPTYKSTQMFNLIINQEKYKLKPLCKCYFSTTSLTKI